MATKEKYNRHFEESVAVNADPKTVFAYADNHVNLSSHMNTSSWMMGGGMMETEVDEGKGQKIGSHIRMNGKVFGINLYLDEVVTVHEAPYRKAWQTVGDINLIVINHYKLGFDIKSEDGKSMLKVFIDYNLPRSFKAKWLGFLFGEMYAKWCVRQMLNGVKEKFK